MEKQVHAKKITSGGQTGADRAALDFAIVRGIPHGGWCPRGRKCEDGIILPRFGLRETPSAAYSQRTEWNVRDSDGTVIFSVADRLAGGSRKTAQFAPKLGKPWLHLSAERPGVDHAALLRWFVQRHQVKVLNVAGPRGSEEPTIAKFVASTLREALTRKMSAKRTLCALVLDDEPCLWLRYQVIPRGFRVFGAESNQQALQTAKQHKAVLVVTDYAHSGQGDGLQLIEAMKKAHPSVPVIMATGCDARGLRRRALRLGACAYLSKPFLFKALLAAVDDALCHPGVKAADREASPAINGRRLELRGSRFLEQRA
jgi:ActR/RegA family two-component response regulator